MTYAPQAWTDDLTPLDEEHMDYMEAGIASAHVTADAAIPKPGAPAADDGLFFVGGVWSAAKVTAARIQAGTITDTQIAAANKDGAAATPSLRSLGAGAQQAAAGNDPRLSDARAPTAHAATHQAGGTDPLGAIPLTAIDAAGDLLVGSGPDAVARLPRGSDGEVLKTVGGALAWAVETGGGGGGIPPTIIDAAGDLIVGAGADTPDRLAAPGTDGHVLTADTSLANKVKWAAPAAPSLPDATAVVKGVLQLAGDLAGTAASPQIAAGAVTDAEVAAANKDGAAGTASLRTLGTGAAQAAPGDDARFPPTDVVVVAGTRILSNKLAGGDANPAWRVLGSGKLEWGAGGGSAPDVTLERTSGGGWPTGLLLNTGIRFATGGSGLVYSFAAGSHLIRNWLLDTDAQAAFRILGNGLVEWGPGGGTAPDTNLKRSAAHILATDDKFDPASLNLQTKAGAPVDGDILGAAADGDVVLDVTNHRLYGRSGGAWKYAQLNGASATIYRKNTTKDVVNTAAETDLLNGEITIAAGAPGTNKRIRGVLEGDYLNDSTAGRGITLRLKLGGTTLWGGATTASAITNGATRRGWRVEFEIDFQAAASQSLVGHFTMGDLTAGSVAGVGNLGAMVINSIFRSNGLTAVDSSIARLLEFTVVHSTNHASLGMRLHYALIEVV